MTDPISPTTAQPSETFEFLSEWFIYDTNSPSGLTWRKRSPRVSIIADHPAGSFNGKYHQVKIMGKRFLCHRIVLVLNGFAPEAGQVADHINRDKRDNRIENLRWVSRSQNCQNTASRPSWSKSGWKFAYLTTSGKYQARYRIPVENKIVRCGSYSTPYEAHLAAITHKLKHHWRI